MNREIYGKFGTNYLAAFQAGNSTQDIADDIPVSEAMVYNAIHRQRIGLNPSKASSMPAPRYGKPKSRKIKFAGFEPTGRGE